MRTRKKNALYSATKYRVRRNVSATALRRLIPRGCHSEFNWNEIAERETAVLIIDQRRKTVVTCAEVQRMLASMGKLREPLRFVIGSNFTHEAAELLAKTGFRIPSLDKVEAAEPTPFPEPVHYSRTDAVRGWHINNWVSANAHLKRLDPDKRNYAIFAFADGSYVQCLGRKTALTVEARVYDSQRLFKHWVFGKGPISGRTTVVGGAAGQVTVDFSQVLRMRDARLIIRQFLETRSFPERYYREDVTERFA
jgi:hypothetical protein